MPKREDTMLSNYKLGNILKRLRTEKNMSLREFSEYLSISHAYLSKLEKGIDPRTGKPITPTIETLTNIACGLDIPTERFLYMCGYFEEEKDTELSEIVEKFMFTIFEMEGIMINGKPVSKDKNIRLNLVKKTLDNMEL